MDLSQLLSIVRRLSDEQGESSENITDFLNDAIAKINIECSALYPSFSLNDSTFVHPLPEQWQRTLFIPFAVGRIKQKESSQFEYSDMYNEFMTNLVEFKAKVILPEEYQDTSIATSYPMDGSGHWYGWE
jgi:hypothetical protein